MLKITGSEDYYPTPEKLLNEITCGIDWQTVGTILEPSAGRGNICEYVKKKNDAAYPRNAYYKREVDLDCVEIEPELRAILKEKGFRVIHDNFLTLHTYKHYDLIIMNPPFSAGAKHLLKAIEVQSLTGGAIICLLNAETLRNPYSNERKDVIQKLKSYGAEIKYYEQAFVGAEKSTDVEVACVKVILPEPERQSTIFETLREKAYEEYEKKAEVNELAESDLVSAFTAQYDREVEWGLKLYSEYLELQEKSLDKTSPIAMSLPKSEFDRNAEKFSVNGYVCAVRRKYWSKLFKNEIFMGHLTSNLQTEYLSQVDKFTNYDFSYWNIKTIQEEMARSLVKGVEDCIINLFDELSARHSWDDDLKNNVHYYNGWKSNSCWKINRRVILPLSAYEKYTGGKYYIELWKVNSKLSDIEKVLNYLDNGETGEVNLHEQLDVAARTGDLQNIRLKYFTVTFYRKGTCHITFTNERLLKKLNIFGSQKKGWLPKGYAKRKYEDMTAEEQAVIESFEGRESYNASVKEAEYYLFDARYSVPMLTA